jgi:hypothetical protein
MVSLVMEFLMHANFTTILCISFQEMVQNNNECVSNANVDTQHSDVNVSRVIVDLLLVIMLQFKINIFKFFQKNISASFLCFPGTSIKFRH